MRDLTPGTKTWIPTLGDRLTVRRSAKGLTRYAVSDVDRRTVGRLEQGEMLRAPLSLLYLLCARYGCSLALLLREGPDSDDFGDWPDKPPSLPSTVQHVQEALRKMRHETGWGAKRLHRESGIESARPSWLYRLEHGQLAHLDMCRLSALALVMDRSVVELLPTSLQ